MEACSFGCSYISSPLTMARRLHKTRPVRSRGYYIHCNMFGGRCNVKKAAGRLSPFDAITYTLTAYEAS